MSKTTVKMFQKENKEENSKKLATWKVNVRTYFFTWSSLLAPVQVTFPDDL
jgi:hypothetical protein